MSEYFMWNGKGWYGAFQEGEVIKTYKVGNFTEEEFNEANDYARMMGLGTIAWYELPPVDEHIIVNWRMTD
jgi:hypothetical protein